MEMTNPQTLAKDQSQWLWFTPDEGKRNRNVTAQTSDKTTFF